MVDNVTTPGPGTVLATDEIGGVHYPRNKIAFGADGSAADVSAANPFPVVDSATAPGGNIFDITPHNTNPLPVITRGITVKAAGSVVLRGDNSSTDVTFANLPVGFSAPWRLEYVRATGTTAELVGVA